MILTIECICKDYISVLLLLLSNKAVYLYESSVHLVTMLCVSLVPIVLASTLDVSHLKNT